MAIFHARAPTSQLCREKQSKGEDTLYSIAKWISYKYYHNRRNLIIIYSLNLVLALGSRYEIKDQIFIKRFGRRADVAFDENLIFYFIPGP